MEKPDLNRMWETFIEIPDLIKLRQAVEQNPVEDNLAKLVNYVCNTIRFKIHPVISRLKKNGIITWYCFLIHDRTSGVPTIDTDESLYFHIRVSFENDATPKNFREALPDYCVMTRKIRRDWIESIVGIDETLLKREEIEEAWRIIGEQSSWLMDMLTLHKEKVDIPVQHVGQFLHFYANMTQLRVE